MSKKTFEQALSQLEVLTDELETDDISLENALSKFNEGMKLVSFCTKKLQEAQSRVDILLKENGDITSKPFDSYNEQEK